MITKLIESNNYHIWTDALHARQLANQTNNKWDRGTYVRWTILTSWIALEIACQDALGDDRISYSFKDNLNNSITSKNLPALDWSQGIWQQVTSIQNLRKNVAHRFASENTIFPDSEVADTSIQVIRKAIKAIYSHCGKEIPTWVDDDADEGWTTGISQFFATAIANNPYYEKEGAIKITFEYKDQEYTWDYLTPDTDISQPLENIFKGVGKPITAVRFYRDKELLIEYLYEASKIRGA